jgi:hypothetical protein
MLKRLAMSSWDMELIGNIEPHLSLRTCFEFQKDKNQDTGGSIDWSFSRLYSGAWQQASDCVVAVVAHDKVLAWRQGTNRVKTVVAHGTPTCDEGHFPAQ